LSHLNTFLTSALTKPSAALRSRVLNWQRKGSTWSVYDSFDAESNPNCTTSKLVGNVWVLSTEWKHRNEALRNSGVHLCIWMTKHHSNPFQRSVRLLISPVQRRVQSKLREYLRRYYIPNIYKFSSFVFKIHNSDIMISVKTKETNRFNCQRNFL
jgi:hypothetical protein